VSDERWIEVPRWDEFQHYTKRDPIWIKNYTRLLRDDAYADLSYAQRGVLHTVWMLYAVHDGVLSERAVTRAGSSQYNDSRYVRRHLEALNHAGFIRFLASKSLASRDRTRERENPTPREGEQKTGAAARAPRVNRDLERITPGTIADAHPDPEARKRQMAELRAGVPWNERP
jgi:hypothetical protein